MPRVATLSNMSSFQQHKNDEIKNKQESVTHASGQGAEIRNLLRGGSAIGFKVTEGKHMGWTESSHTEGKL